MADATLDILLNETIGTINPNIYGHFMEHLGYCVEEGCWVGEDSPIANTDGIRNDVTDALREVGDAAEVLLKRDVEAGDGDADRCDDEDRGQQHGDEPPDRHARGLESDDEERDGSLRGDRRADDGQEDRKSVV